MESWKLLKELKKVKRVLFLSFIGWVAAFITLFTYADQNNILWWILGTCIVYLCGLTDQYVSKKIRQIDWEFDRD